MSIDPEYMDTESALKRVGGNTNLYKKLLTLFLAESHINDLCNAVENGSLEEAAQLAHTVKGVCANLSLTKLRTVSADIEAKLKGGEDCKEDLQELKTTSEETVAIIKEYIG